MSLTMTREEREAFLADLHVGVIAINREGRGPLTAPIWYDYEPGGDAWVLISADSKKAALLQDGLRVSLCAQSETAPYRYVSIEGPVSVRATAPGELLAMATRYLGEQGGAEYAAGSEGNGGLTVRITPQSWLSVDYPKRA